MRCVERTANLAVHELNRELARWPDWNDAGSATLFFTPGGTLTGSRDLLGWPNGILEPSLPPSALRAQELEIRGHDHSGALRLYAIAVNTMPAPVRRELVETTYPLGTGLLQEKCSVGMANPSQNSSISCNRRRLCAARDPCHFV